LKAKYYPESRFGGFSDIDGTISFYSHVRALVSEGSTILDVGCGRGAYLTDPVAFRSQLRQFKGRCRQVIGIDVDPNAEQNPNLDEFRLIQAPTWPIEAESIDLCICDYVIEHVSEPGSFIKECQRVLRPGGFLCIRTSNLWSYFGLFARFVPNPSHVGVLRKAKGGVSEKDTFVTFFRCNTIPRLKKMLADNQFEAVVYGYNAEPAYLNFSALTYYLGVLYQKHSPNLFRVGIHAFARKKAPA
jgi:SAM-dependent methyltransferase